MKWIALGLAVFAFPGSCRAGTVHTTDGRDVAGDVQIEANSVVVTAPQVEDQRFAPAQIASIDFRPQPAEAIKDAPGLGGLKAEYFLDNNFNPARRKVLRLDPVIDFNWRWNRDALLMPNEGAWVPFSVRWTGQIRPLFSEKYVLRLRNPASQNREIHAKVWVDQKLVIGDGADAGEADFQAGHLSDLRIDLIASRFEKHSNQGSFRLMWESEHQPRQIVPSTCLYLPTKVGDLPVLTRIGSPTAPTELFSPADISISTKVELAQRPLDRVELLANKIVVSESETSPGNSTWKNPPIGDYEMRITAITRDGQKWPGGSVRIIVADNDSGNIPAPWARFNIPGNAAPEPVKFADRKITLTRTGGELYARKDQCQFLYQMLTGDGEITARLSDVTAGANAAPASAAGLMIRKSLTDDCRECGLLFQPGVGPIFLHRDFDGETSLNTPSVTPAPGYMRLIRDGLFIRAYRSDDGINWQFVDQKQMDLPETVLVGMTISAQGAAAVTATFQDAAVTSRGPHRYIDNSAGVLLIDGSRLNGQLIGCDKGIVTLERGDKQTRRHIAIGLKKVARIHLHPTPGEDPPAGWHGVVLSHGDQCEGEVKFIGSRDVRVDSDVFGPKNFSLDRDVASVLLAGAAVAPTKFLLVLTDGSELHATSVEMTEGAISIDTIFASGLKIQRSELKEFRSTMPASEPASTAPALR